MFKNKLSITLIWLATWWVAVTASAQSLTEANHLFYSDRYDKAAEAFAALAKAAPADALLQLQYGKALVAAGNVKDAKTLYQQLAGAADEPYGQIANARLLILDGKEAEAKKILEKVARRKSKDAAYVRAAAESFMYGEKANYNLAVEYLSKAQEASTKDPATYMAFGDAYYELNEGGKAASNYEFAADFDKTTSAPFYKVAKIFKRSKNNQFYVANLEKAVERNPKYAQAYQLLGDYYYEAAKYDKAKENYKKYLDLVGGSLDDKLYYANMLYLTKDYPNTITYVEDLQKQDDSKAYLYRLLGRSYFELGDSVKALAAMSNFFQKATPDKILSSDYEYYGRLLLKNNRGEEAVNAFESCIAIDSTGESKKYYADIAEMYFKKKDYATAAKYYRLRAESAKVQSAQDYFDLGISYYYSKNYPAADSAFAKIVELRPDALTGYLWRAKTTVKLEPDIETNPADIATYGLAKPHYEKVLEIATDKAKYKKEIIDAANYLSYYHYKKGDNESAKSYLVKTLELDPADTYASELYKTLGGQ